MPPAALLHAPAEPESFARVKLQACKRIKVRAPGCTALGSMRSAVQILDVRRHGMGAMQARQKRHHLSIKYSSTSRTRNPDAGCTAAPTHNS